MVLQDAGPCTFVQKGCIEDRRRVHTVEGSGIAAGPELDESNGIGLLQRNSTRLYGAGVEGFQVAPVDFRRNTRPDRLDGQHHAEIALLADQHTLHTCERSIFDAYALANRKDGVRLKLANIYSVAKGLYFMVCQRPRLPPGAHYGEHPGHSQ